MSALPAKADLKLSRRDVRFVPKAEFLRCSSLIGCFHRWVFAPGTRAHFMASPVRVKERLVRNRLTVSVCYPAERNSALPLRYLLRRSGRLRPEINDQATN